MQGLSEDEKESTESDKGTAHENSKNIVRKNSMHIVQGSSVPGFYEISRIVLEKQHAPRG